MHDKNDDGFINVEELGAALKNSGQEVADEDLKKIIKVVDQNGDGLLNLEGRYKLLSLTLCMTLVSYLRNSNLNSDKILSCIINLLIL